MKNFALGIVVLLALCLVSSVYGQASFGKAVDRRADIMAAQAKIQPVDPARIPELENRLASAKQNAVTSQVAPYMLIASYGNTNVGLTVYGYNAQVLPSGTIVYAVKVIDGVSHPMSWTTFFGDMPAGYFRYDLEKGKQSTWTEYNGVIRYEIYTLLPDGSSSFAYKTLPVNKWWPGMANSQKLITSGVGKFPNGAPTITLQGPIVATGGPISVMVKDYDVDYDQRPVPFMIRGGKLILNLLASGIEVPPNSEILVIVGTADGRTSQLTVVMDGEGIVWPAAK